MQPQNDSRGNFILLYFTHSYKLSFAISPVFRCQSPILTIHRQQAWLNFGMTPRMKVSNPDLMALGSVRRLTSEDQPLTFKPDEQGDSGCSRSMGMFWSLFQKLYDNPSLAPSILLARRHNKYFYRLYNINSADCAFAMVFALHFRPDS
jgi:hypothetical protein